jgi:hypothetical protein
MAFISYYNSRLPVNSYALVNAGAAPVICFYVCEFLNFLPYDLGITALLLSQLVINVCMVALAIHLVTLP